MNLYKAYGVRNSNEDWCPCFKTLPDLNPLFDKIYADWKNANANTKKRAGRTLHNIDQYIDSLEINVDFGTPCTDECNIKRFMTTDTLKKYIGYYIGHLLIVTYVGMTVDHQTVSYCVNYAHYQLTSGFGDPSSSYLDRLMIKCGQLMGKSYPINVCEPNVYFTGDTFYIKYDKKGDEHVKPNAPHWCHLIMNFKSYLNQYTHLRSGFVEKHEVNFRNLSDPPDLPEHPSYDNIPSGGYMNPFYLGFKINFILK